MSHLNRMIHWCLDLSTVSPAHGNVSSDTSGPASPVPNRAERLNLRVCRYDRHTFDTGLRSEKSIEGIAMRSWHETRCADVQNTYG